MSRIPRTILIKPANIPITNDNTNSDAITRIPCDLTMKRRENGKTRNSAPVAMSVQPNIFFIPESRFSLRAVTGAITSNERMKIKYGKFCREESEDKGDVIRTRITVNPHASTTPLPIDSTDFRVMFISIFLYMHIHLVKGYLDTFLLKPGEHLPENPVHDRMPVVVMFDPHYKLEIL